MIVFLGPWGNIVEALISWIGAGWGILVNVAVGRVVCLDQEREVEKNEQ